MSRTQRKISEANLYHVFARGVGRQMIFEDHEDNLRFLDLLSDSAEKANGSLLAWCLMGNHFHLLARMEMLELSRFMKRLEVAYALYFNSRYDRPGCLFQGRFGSEPISDDAQLLAAVRYIHLNPQKAGIARFDAYEWSSYKEYADGPSLCETDFVLGIVGGRDAFRRLHEGGGSDGVFMECNTSDGKARANYVSDADIKRILAGLFGKDWRTAFPAASKGQRDDALCQLKESGATVRQISRITGIGRGIVQRAKR